METKTRKLYIDCPAPVREDDILVSILSGDKIGTVYHIFESKLSKRKKDRYNIKVFIANDLRDQLTIFQKPFHIQLKGKECIMFKWYKSSKLS